MSAAATRQSKRARRACQECRERKARFRRAESVRANRDHTLCFACYRAQRERRRAQLLAQVPHAAPLRLPFEDEVCAVDAVAALGSGQEPDARQLEHRRRMLRHLEATARARVHPRRLHE